MPTVLNAANEIAVEAFLAGQIGFGDIARLVGQVCEDAERRNDAREAATIEDALAVDHIVRESPGPSWPLKPYPAW